MFNTLAARADTAVMARKPRGPVHRTTGRIPQISHRELAGGRAAVELTEIEEDFFRAGDLMSEPFDFSDLDEGYQPTTLWRSLVGWLRGERTSYAE